MSKIMITSSKNFQKTTKKIKKESSNKISNESKILESSYSKIKNSKIIQCLKFQRPSHLEPPLKLSFFLPLNTGLVFI